MSKTNLYLISYSFNIIALCETINNHLLFSMMIYLFDFILLYISEKNDLSIDEFNRGDLLSLIVQIPLILLISSLLNINIFSIAFSMIIILILSKQIKKLERKQCLKTLRLISLGSIVVIIGLIYIAFLIFKYNKSFVFYPILILQLTIPFLLSYIAYKTFELNRI